MLDQQELICCKQCGAHAPISAMKYNSTGEKLICGMCYNKEHRKVEFFRSVGTPAPKQRRFNLNAERITYECGHCGYQFTRKKGIDVMKCPYCGRDEVDKFKPKTAQDIIQEISEY